MTAIPQRHIGSTGIEVSVLGFGAAALGNLYRAQTDVEAYSAIATALEVGIRYFDTAPRYGHGLSERRLGLHLPADTILSTKVGRILTPIDPPPSGTERHGFVDGDPFEEFFDYSYDGVMRAFESSQLRLQREHVDIILAHDIGHFTHGANHPVMFAQFIKGGLKAMQSLKSQGLVKAIGLGVNEGHVCNEVLDHVDMDLILLAGRYTLLEQQPLQDLLPRCLQRGVSVVIGGPFNSGILSAARREQGGPVMYDYAPAPQPILDRVDALRRVCDAHSVTLPAAALQFPLAHPTVVSIIPGMETPDRIRQNLAYLNQPIPPAFWSDLKNEKLIHPLAPTPQPAGE